MKKIFFLNLFSVILIDKNVIKDKNFLEELKYLRNLKFKGN